MGSPSPTRLCTPSQCLTPGCKSYSDGVEGKCWLEKYSRGLQWGHDGVSMVVDVTYNIWQCEHLWNCEIFRISGGLCSSVEILYSGGLYGSQKGKPAVMIHLFFFFSLSPSVSSSSSLLPYNDVQIGNTNYCNDTKVLSRTVRASLSLTRSLSLSLLNPDLSLLSSSLAHLNHLPLVLSHQLPPLKC